MSFERDRVSPRKKAFKLKKGFYIELKEKASGIETSRNIKIFCSSKEEVQNKMNFYKSKNPEFLGFWDGSKFEK